MEEMESTLVLREGRYHCERILGEGSMGRTYLARDEETGKQVAVKALFPSRLATHKDFELFEREAGILQRMDHPQIPRYVDAFSDGEGEDLCYFIVQGFVEGQTLQRVLETKARFSEEDLIELMTSLAKVLQYIHGLEPLVVHRDIKPSNVILRGPEEVPTLVDFGAVREVVRLTMGGGSTIIGTYGYMPPEQLMGRATPASDLYSLGITALECLTRRTPRDLHGEDTRRMIDEVQISEDLKRVMRRLCEPRLDSRYETAQQLIEDLEAVGTSKELVHAGTIERQVDRRVRDEMKALARSTGRGVSLVFGVIALVILSTIIVGGFLFAYALADVVEAPMFLAFLITLPALLVPMGLMGQRYTQDAWFAPRPDWVKTRGKTQEGKTWAEFGPPVTDIVYTFELPGGRKYQADNPAFQVRNFRSQLENGEPDARLGVEFDVFYPPGNPATYCRVDIVHSRRGGEDEIEVKHHFDHQIPHHPT